VAGDDRKRSNTSSSRRERFELERFEWKAPDRLEVAGKFYGLQQAQFDEPVLVVSGGGGGHRLRAVREVVAGQPEDGKPWRAQFAWDETPVGVEAATLEFGPDIAVELPAPGAKRTLLRPRFVEVRRAHHTDDAAADSAAAADADPEAPTVAGDVTLQAELVAAEQQVREVRAALDRAEADLARARADVDAERKGRTADAERFREGLARVRASAEQALAGAQDDAQELAAQLSDARAAHEERDGALADLREQLEAAEAARAQAENERQGQEEALRKQVAASDELRTRITALGHVGDEAGEMRADAQRLLERLTRLVDALDGGK
jgi:hypothetical protein